MLWVSCIVGIDQEVDIRNDQLGQGLGDYRIYFYFVGDLIEFLAINAGTIRRTVSLHLVRLLARLSF